MIMNNNTYPIYGQVFDTPAATVITLGVNTPSFVIPLPANAGATLGFAANLEMANGVNIANSIRMGFTTAPNVASVVATGVVGSIWYV
jgi:hypothetical protein